MFWDNCYIVSGFRFRVTLFWGLGFRVTGVLGLGFRVILFLGLYLGLQCFGFGVQSYNYFWLGV